MDVVITYVNMSDPEWIKQYTDVFNDTPNTSRYQELGTLNLQVQCIRKFMPWVKNIFIVVSSHSQVPSIEGVTVITHDQIIPQEYLPTFNSCTIELFLHKIPGLSDYFIYFNDDIFPINYLDESEFFTDKPVLCFKSVIEPPHNVFRHQCKNSSNLARILAGLSPSYQFIKPDHICLTHSKQAYEFAWKQLSKTLQSSISKRRENKNINQYLFADYLYYSNTCELRRLNYTYFKYSSNNLSDLQKTILSRKFSLICVQDDCPDTVYNDVLVKSLQENLRN